MYLLMAVHLATQRPHGRLEIASCKGLITFLDRTLYRLHSKGERVTGNRGTVSLLVTLKQGCAVLSPVPSTCFQMAKWSIRVSSNQILGLRNLGLNQWNSVKPQLSPSALPPPRPWEDGGENWGEGWSGQSGNSLDGSCAVLGRSQDTSKRCKWIINLSKS